MYCIVVLHYKYTLIILTANENSMNEIDIVFKLCDKTMTSCNHISNVS